ncbi:glycoside hydrolase [Geoanaerobacter pelophilus]|uniref:Glycoside hydrolase n=1 Tax=Geoanaerobacter pelophilus TaxID=60036 RepID=A0ABQ0MLK0_9BACT|nr:glycoside hydrolase [Geoanaerobacter pelophilus]
MRVGIISPNYYAEETGNAVTVRRIERHLKELGCEVKVFATDRMVGEKLQGAVAEFAPDILHAFHAYHGGRMACVLSKVLGIPYLVTFTGTDIYNALCDQRNLELHGALRGASRLVAFHGCVRHRLAKHMPSLEERTAIIPQGVDLPFDCTPLPPAEEGSFTFLLPAGLRPVKNVLFPLEPLAALYAAHPQVRLLLAGPVLDKDYAAQVMEALERYPFARYLGVVGHDLMGDLYRRIDVVLNSSLSEGGMANTVLEAMAYAKPLLVADIEGNRSVVKEHVTGLLYRDAGEFVAKAGELLADARLREKLGKNGKAQVREHYSPDKEAVSYLNLYREILLAK